MIKSINEIIKDIIEMNEYPSNKEDNVNECAKDIDDYIKKNYIPRELLKDKKFIINILKGMVIDEEYNEFKNNPYIYLLIDEELKKDKEILYLISLPSKKYNNNTRKGLPNFYQYLPEDVLKDKERVKILWKSNKKYNYDDLPDSLKNDIEVCLECVTIRKDFPKLKTYDETNILNKIPKDIKNNKYFIIGYIDRINDNKEINKLTIKDADTFTEVMSKDKRLKEVALNEWISSLMYLVPKTKLEDVINIIKENKEKYKVQYKIHNELFSSNEYFKKILSNLEMMDFYSKIEKTAYEEQVNLLINSFNKEVINNKDNWAEIIEKNPAIYESIKDMGSKFNINIEDNLLNDKELAETAIKKILNNIIYAPDEIKKDVKLIEYGLENSNIHLSPILINDVYEIHKDNKELISKICIKNPTSVMYLGEEYRKDIIFLYNIIKENINIYEFLDVDIKRLGAKNEILNIMEKSLFKESLEKEISEKSKIKKNKI